MKIKINLVVLALFAVSCSGAFAQDKNAAPSGPKQDSVYYTCSMHPEIRAAAPGQCPKCGMQLIKETYSAGKKEKKHKMSMGCGMMGGMGGMGTTEHSDQDTAVKTDQHSTAGDSRKQGAVLYACSMHPEIQSTEPGYCSKCGMRLSEIKK